MAQQTIRLTEGDDNVVYTITVKRAGVVEDLTAMFEGTGSVKLYAHADGAPLGTNQINGVACTDVDKVNGAIAFTFLADDHTDIDGGSDLRGAWALKLDDDTKIEWTKQEPFELTRNPFVAVA